MINVYGVMTGYHFCCIISVKETDVEDDTGNIMKEVYVQPVEPLEFHAEYRLASEDPAIFSDGGEDDRDGWVCTRAWPQMPIPTHKPTTSTNRPSTSLATEAPYGSSHSQLKMKATKPAPSVKMYTVVPDT